jgi:uncharacterized RmlC-like cupin family protein
MGLIREVEVRSLTSIKGGMAEFYTPQASHETMLVQVPAHARDDLFVHHFQTDQLLVVRNSFVLVVLQNRRYRYIALCETHPAVVQISPGIPHGAINLSGEPCVLVNAVLRHGPTHQRDYRPMTPPRPYDLAAAQAAIDALRLPMTA